MATKSYPVLQKTICYLDPDDPTGPQLRKITQTESDLYPEAFEAIYGTGSKGWFVRIDAKQQSDTTTRRHSTLAPETTT